MKKYFFRTQNSNGFTLIELLVIIAILSILSTVALAIIGSSRDKARAASAITSLKSMINAAQLAADGTGKFPSNLCVENPNFPDWGSLDQGVLRELAQAVQKNAKTPPLCSINTGFGQQPTEWAAFVVLPANTPQPSYYCVDSSYFSGYGYVAGPKQGKCVPPSW